MPLLDAALAFALVMLGLSSLVGMAQEWLHKLRAVRGRHLQDMLEHLADELLKLSGSPLPKTAEHEDPNRNFQNFGLEQVVKNVTEGQLDHLPADHLLAALSHSPWAAELCGKLQDSKLPAELSHKVNGIWQRLENEQTTIFRQRAKTSATWVALLLAFALNIDSLHLIESFIGNHGAVGQTLDNASDVASGEALLWAAAPLPIGWNRFPNCPGTSTDPRCFRYWSAAAQQASHQAPQDGKVPKLSFGDKKALNPIHHPRLALGLLPDAMDPVSTSVHMSTDGGPPQDGAAQTVPELPQSFHGALSLWSVIAWLLGCTLTGILAGQGSPFWIEVVRRLGVTRDELRDKRRLRDEKRLRDQRRLPEDSES